jgi:hypothetical protein
MTGDGQDRTKTVERHLRARFWTSPSTKRAATATTINAAIRWHFTTARTRYVVPETATATTASQQRGLQLSSATSNVRYDNG